MGTWFIWKEGSSMKKATFPAFGLLVSSLVFLSGCQAAAVPEVSSQHCNYNKSRYFICFWFSFPDCHFPRQRDLENPGLSGRRYQAGTAWGRNLLLYGGRWKQKASGYHRIGGYGNYWRCGRLDHSFNVKRSLPSDFSERQRPFFMAVRSPPCKHFPEMFPVSV